MITGNEPAKGFGYSRKRRNPQFGHGNSEQYINDSVEYSGLTIRQYFAGLAMQGLVTQQLPVDRALNEANSTLVHSIAAASVKMADALIEALNKPTKQIPNE